MSQHVARNKPLALLIGGHAASILSFNALMKQAGFAVSIAASVVHGYEHAVRALAATSKTQPAVIVIDTADSYGVLVAAALAHKMQQQHIPPAWLIGLVDQQDGDRANEAVAAGLHYMLPVPLAGDTGNIIQQLAMSAPPIPYTANKPEAIQPMKAMQTLAARILQAILETKQACWTPQDIGYLLYALTLYPLKRSAKNLDAACIAEEIIDILGGQQAARNLLERCVYLLQPKYPLHSDILQKFLDGWERREIVRYFVQRKLYEDSRIYHCINELPQRICDMLRVSSI